MSWAAVLTDTFSKATSDVCENANVTYAHRVDDPGSLSCLSARFGQLEGVAYATRSKLYRARRAGIVHSAMIGSSPAKPLPASTMCRSLQLVHRA
jgi:hypothetical protein